MTGLTVLLLIQVKKPDVVTLLGTNTPPPSVLTSAGAVVVLAAMTVSSLMECLSVGYTLHVTEPKLVKMVRIASVRFASLLIRHVSFVSCRNHNLHTKTLTRTITIAACFAGPLHRRRRCPQQALSWVYLISRDPHPCHRLYLP